MVSTTGEEYAYYELDADLVPVRRELPAALAPTVALIDENCEPALCTVLFVAGAGGSLRAGVTANPVRLTRAVQAHVTRLTCGGAPVYVWPGGGITFMVDVTAPARGRLRLRADAGAGRAARVHHGPRRLPRARRPRPGDPLARRHRCATAASTRPPAPGGARAMNGPQAAGCPTGGGCTSSTARST